MRVLLPKDINGGFQNIITNIILFSFLFEYLTAMQLLLTTK